MESLQKPQIANETTDSGFVGSEVPGIWTASEMGTLLREKACLWAWGEALLVDKRLTKQSTKLPSLRTSPVGCKLTGARQGW